jgi:hypothetical protein
MLKLKCVDCSPCPHGKLKYTCAAYKLARAVQASSPPTKPEPKLKPEPEIKEEPFNIHGYYNTGD